MHLAVGRINRDTGGRTSDTGRQMAGIAVCRIRHPSKMIRNLVAYEVRSVAGHASTCGVGYGVRGKRYVEQ